MANGFQDTGSPFERFLNTIMDADIFGAEPDPFEDPAFMSRARTVIDALPEGSPRRESFQRLFEARDPALRQRIEELDQVSAGGGNIPTSPTPGLLRQFLEDPLGLRTLINQMR